MTLSEELAWRGFENQTTLKDKSELDTQQMTFYWGVDPSASSMTIGHLAAAMMVKTFIKHGYKAVLLVGGATGLIGDPDGKAQERQLKTIEEIKNNTRSLIEQYKTLFEGQDFKIVDNYEWFKNIGYLEFLRNVGKHVPMRQMLGREFVQTRLSEDGSGISYAEFSYSLIQGYDFLHLFNEYGVTLQLAGSDQWGNSIAGVDLIRRITGKDANVWTFPLIINKETGVKFGKTEAGAVWLDASKTSPYQFYQFWLNTDDAVVENYLKVFTNIEKSELDEVMKDFNSDKSARKAQRYLAYKVTGLVHGSDVADSVVRVTNVLFGGQGCESLQPEDLNALMHELPVVDVHMDDDLIHALTTSELAGSNSEARRFLEQGGVYINGHAVTLEKKLEKNDFLNDSYAILRRGKNKNAIIRLVD